MKKVYVVCLNKNSFPLGIFQEKKDARNFMDLAYGLPPLAWGRRHNVAGLGQINYAIEEFCLWEKGQNPHEILNSQTGFTHADYAKKYYGFPEEKKLCCKKK